jgi:hypothetical protein
MSDTTTTGQPGTDPLMQLVEQLSPETRARIARRLDDRFHELTGTPRHADGAEADGGRR